MESVGQYLVRHRVDGLHLKSAVGSVESAARMVHAQGRLDERPSLDPPGEISLHWGDHQPEMFLAKLMQKAEIAHNHEQCYRMISILDRNWWLCPIEVYTIVEMRAHDRVGYTFRVHPYRRQIGTL